jgi:hypothetical protein
LQADLLFDAALIERMVMGIKEHGATAGQHAGARSSPGGTP